jgi:hypothetical protein
MTWMLSKLHRLMDRLGWGPGALYLVHRGLQAVSGGGLGLHCYYLVHQPVGAGPILPAHLKGGVAVRQMTAADPQIARALTRPAELGTRLARGDACLAALRAGEVVGYLWLCFDGFEDDETGCRFRPAPGGAWDYDMWVAAGSRGGPVFPALWDAAWDLLRQRGYRWSASRVSAFNDQSLRAHRRIGARPTATILVLRAGNAGVVLSTIGSPVKLFRSSMHTTEISVQPPAPPA